MLKIHELAKKIDDLELKCDFRGSDAFTDAILEINERADEKRKLVTNKDPLALAQIEEEEKSEVFNLVLGLLESIKKEFPEIVAALQELQESNAKKIPALSHLIDSASEDSEIVKDNLLALKAELEKEQQQIAKLKIKLRDCAISNAENLGNFILPLGDGLECAFAKFPRGIPSENAGYEPPIKNYDSPETGRARKIMANCVRHFSFLVDVLSTQTGVQKSSEEIEGEAADNSVYIEDIETIISCLKQITEAWGYSLEQEVRQFCEQLVSYGKPPSIADKNARLKHKLETYKAYHEDFSILSTEKLISTKLEQQLSYILSTAISFQQGAFKGVMEAFNHENEEKLHALLFKSPEKDEHNSDDAVYELIEFFKYVLAIRKEYCETYMFLKTYELVDTDMTKNLEWNTRFCAQVYQELEKICGSDLSSKAIFALDDDAVSRLEIQLDVRSSFASASELENETPRHFQPEAMDAALAEITAVEKTLQNAEYAQAVADITALEQQVLPEEPNQDDAVKAITRNVEVTFDEKLGQIREFMRDANERLSTAKTRLKRFEGMAHISEASRDTLDNKINLIEALLEVIKENLDTLNNPREDIVSACHYIRTMHDYCAQFREVGDDDTSFVGSSFSGSLMNDETEARSVQDEQAIRDVLVEAKESFELSKAFFAGHAKLGSIAVDIMHAYFESIENALAEMSALYPTPEASLFEKDTIKSAASQFSPYFVKAGMGVYLFGWVGIILGAIILGGVFASTPVGWAVLGVGALMVITGLAIGLYHVYTKAAHNDPEVESSSKMSSEVQSVISFEPDFNLRAEDTDKHSEASYEERDEDRHADKHAEPKKENLAVQKRFALEAPFGKMQTFIAQEIDADNGVATVRESEIDPEIHETHNALQVLKTHHRGASFSEIRAKVVPEAEPTHQIPRSASWPRLVRSGTQEIS